MIAQTPRLVTLLRLWDRLPVAPPPALRSRGRPKDYSDGLFVKALVVMIVRRLTKVHELLSVLEEPTREMRRLKALLHEQGRFPSRRTWDRRLNQVPDTLPEQIALVGTHLLALLQPWMEQGRAGAIDSTLLRAKGGMWHKKIAKKAACPIPRLILKPTGANPNGTAGSMAGNCMSSSRWPMSGYRWPPT